MKRIVQCPKCEVKLAVFDIGKPLSQKCPKCNHAFLVASEHPLPKPSVPAVAAPAPVEPPAPPAPEATVPPTPAPSPEAPSQPDTQATVPPTPDAAAAPAPTPTTEAASQPETRETAQPALRQKPGKTISLKTPVKKPAPAAASRAPTAPVPETPVSPAPEPLAAPASPAGSAPSLKAAALARPAGPTAAPRPSPSAPAPVIQHASGVSFLHVAVLFGFLILSIIMQVMSAKKSEARFNALDKQLESIRAQLQSISKK